MLAALPHYDVNLSHIDFSYIAEELRLLIAEQAVSSFPVGVSRAGRWQLEGGVETPRYRAAAAPIASAGQSALHDTSTSGGQASESIAATTSTV